MTIGLSALLLPFSSQGKNRNNEFKGLYENLPFRMERIRRPSV